jgi:hypothetical protein
LADISTIWLVCLGFILCLIPLAIFGAMAFGMHKLLSALPPVFKQGQEGIATVAQAADRTSKKVAAPFISVSASASRAKGTLRGLRKLVGGTHDLEE